MKGFWGDTELGTRPSECLHTPQGRKGLREQRENGRVAAQPHSAGLRQIAPLDAPPGHSRLVAPTSAASAELTEDNNELLSIIRDIRHT